MLAVQARPFGAKTHLVLARPRHGVARPTQVTPEEDEAVDGHERPKASALDVEMRRGMITCIHGDLARRKTVKGRHHGSDDVNVGNGCRPGNTMGAPE